MAVEAARDAAALLTVEDMLLPPKYSNCNASSAERRFAWTCSLKCGASTSSTLSISSQCQSEEGAVATDIPSTLGETVLSNAIAARSQRDESGSSADTSDVVADEEGDPAVLLTTSRPSSGLSVVQEMLAKEVTSASCSGILELVSARQRRDSVATMASAWSGKEDVLDGSPASAQGDTEGLTALEPSIVWSDKASTSAAESVAASSPVLAGAVEDITAAAARLRRESYQTDATIVDDEKSSHSRVSIVLGEPDATSSHNASVEVLQEGDDSSSSVADINAAAEVSELRDCLLSGRVVHEKAAAACVEEQSLSQRLKQQLESVILARDDRIASLQAKIKETQATITWRDAYIRHLEQDKATAQAAAEAAVCATTACQVARTDAEIRAQQLEVEQSRILHRLHGMQRLKRVLDGPSFAAPPRVGQPHKFLHTTTWQWRPSPRSHSWGSTVTYTPAYPAPGRGKQWTASVSRTYVPALAVG